MIVEHIRSSVATADAEAWLVDGFGQAHAVAPRSIIGRNYESQIVVLTPSVSREHAELRYTEGGWSVRDIGSHNGVLLDGARIKGRAILPGRAIVKVGDVALWFLAQVAARPADPRSMATLDAHDGVVNYVLTPSDGPELRLIGNADGGALMKSGDAAGERRLPQLEFQLLRTLCLRADAESSSPSATRGCVGPDGCAAGGETASVRPEL
jgi:pSer/pThr/pTyr-binding forkhead associated (FHA) protein